MADRDGVVDRRILPGTVAGVVGLVFAIAAIVVHNRIVLVLATIFTAVAVLLILTAPDVPLRYRDRRRRRADTNRLADESERMAARAARFEAEAIAAKEELAAAMLAEHARQSPLGPERPVPDEGPPHDAPAGTGPPEQPAASVPSTDDPELILDGSSGLFNQAFFEASLVKRISAARRGLRPLTLALMEVRCRLGEPEETDADPHRVATVIEATVRDADTVARTTDGLFAILLEDTPENGAIWTLERIRRRLTEDIDQATVRAGVSCYPAYGFDADQLWSQAGEALDVARECRQDRIEVTTAEPDG